MLAANSYAYCACETTLPLVTEMRLASIWTMSRPRTGARITRVLSAVCIAACGGKGSLLGSRVRPTAVKPMGPKVQEERVGEAEP
jgi:hypothetical protein